VQTVETPSSDARGGLPGRVGARGDGAH
jgi:hypothetical protein